MKKAVVLGAGIQGTCVALMLNKLRYDVCLLDMGSDVINYTSRNGEGKIHLGMVYGLDKSLQTAKKLNLDALNFSNYIEYLTGRKPDWKRLKSTPFYYLVANDSLLAADEAEEYFEHIQTVYTDHIKDEHLNYLGLRPDRLFTRTEVPNKINRALFQRCFKTEEVAIHTLTLRSLLKSKLLATSIDIRLNTLIEEIMRVQEGIRVDFTTPDGRQSNIKSEIVINCLWANKMKFDSMMDLPADDYSLRLKYGIRIQRAPGYIAIPSFTIIQGPYGDFVNYPSQDEAYISWYPYSMKGFISGREIPRSWQHSINNDHDASTIQQIKIQHYSAYSQIIHDLPPLMEKELIAGVILAKGDSDISETESQLHFRNEFPIMVKDGYYSINTGKYTSAPHNTKLLERMLVQ